MTNGDPPALPERIHRVLARLRIMRTLINQVSNAVFESEYLIQDGTTAIKYRRDGFSSFT